MEATHRRCYSDPTWRKKEKKDTPADVNKSSCSCEKTEGKFSVREVHPALNEEIMELQCCLENHVATRREMEKALIGSAPHFCNSVVCSIPKPIKKLIQEITMLERDVSNLEQHLLSLYRNVLPETATVHAREIHQKAADSCRSLPLFMLEKTQNVGSDVSVSDDQMQAGTHEDIWQMPNRLSEEMIKSISFIYCELSETPNRMSDYTSTPFIISSLQNEVSSNGQDDPWRIPYENFSTFISAMNSPSCFDTFGLPYSSMKAVHAVSKNPQKISAIQHELHAFRSLAYQLELVNPVNMKHVEKLAFWINIHNTLVMHSFLVNGIPRSGGKRVSSLLKAAYNVGGHIVSIEMIQASILQCQLPRPKQWLKPLFPSKSKLRARDARQAYAIDHQEPRLYFALCSGNFSDPAVRVYTPNKVFDELEIAREEFIQSNIIIQQNQKIYLPKIMDHYAKDQELHLPGLIDMIEHLLPDCVRCAIRQFPERQCKAVHWMPHSFSFRYIFANDLA